MFVCLFVRSFVVLVFFVCVGLCSWKFLLFFFFFFSFVHLFVVCLFVCCLSVFVGVGLCLWCSCLVHFPCSVLVEVSSFCSFVGLSVGLSVGSSVVLAFFVCVGLCVVFLFGASLVLVEVSSFLFCAFLSFLFVSFFLKQSHLHFCMSCPPLLVLQPKHEHTKRKTNKNKSQPTTKQLLQNALPTGPNGSTSGSRHFVRVFAKPNWTTKRPNCTPNTPNTLSVHGPDK